MNKTLKRGLIAMAVCIVVFVIGCNLVGGSGMYYSNDGLVFLAAVLAGGCYWIGSRE